MNQRNLQLLQADAALAGTDDALRQRLNRLTQRRIICKSRDHAGRVIYALPSQEPLSLFDSS